MKRLFVSFQRPFGTIWELVVNGREVYYLKLQG